MLIDLERRVFNALPVVFRSVKNNRARDKAVLVPRVRQVTPPKLLADDRCLDQRGAEQIAGNDHDSSILLQRMVVGPNDIGVQASRILVVLARGAAGHGECASTNLARLHQLAEDRAYPAGTMVSLSEKFTRWLYVGQQMNLVPNMLPVANVQIHAHVTSNGDDVWWAIGRPTNRRIHHDRILEGFPGKDPAGGEIFAHHLYDSVPGQ